MYTVLKAEEPQSKIVHVFVWVRKPHKRRKKSCIQDTTST